MVAELAIFERLSSFEVKDRHTLVVKEHIWVLENGSRGWSNDFGSWELGTGAGSHGPRCDMAVLGVSTEGNGIR